MKLTKIRNPIDIKGFKHRNMRDIRGSPLSSDEQVTSSTRQTLIYGSKYRELGYRICLTKRR